MGKHIQIPTQHFRTFILLCSLVVASLSFVLVSGKFSDANSQSNIPLLQNLGLVLPDNFVNYSTCGDGVCAAGVENISSCSRDCAGGSLAAAEGEEDVPLPDLTVENLVITKNTANNTVSYSADVSNIGTQNINGSIGGRFCFNSTAENCFTNLSGTGMSQFNAINIEPLFVDQSKTVQGTSTLRAGDETIVFCANIQRALRESDYENNCVSAMINPTDTVTTTPTGTATPTITGVACNQSCVTDANCAGAPVGGCTVCGSNHQCQRPTGTPTNTLTPTPTGTSVACNEECSQNSDCAGASDGCTVCGSGGTCQQPTNPTNTSTPTPTSSTPPPTLTVPPTTTPGNTSIALDLSLPGIGSVACAATSSGQTNAATGSGSFDPLGNNCSPLHPSRSTEVFVYNAQNELVGEPITNLSFDKESYKGTVSLDLESGSYTIMTRMDNTLKKRLAGIQNITSGTTNAAPSAQLTSGDVDQNNILDLLDWNELINCYRTSNPTLGLGGCQLSDLNDDGAVEEVDVNILSRGFAIRDGDDLTNSIKPTLTLTPTTTGTTAMDRPLQCGVFGDVNNDGIINKADSDLISAFILNTITDSAAEEMVRTRGDMDADGEITAQDTLIITRYTTGNNTAFVACTRRPLKCGTYGDANNDGIITMTDINILNDIVNTPGSNPTQYDTLGDVNANGGLDSGDITLLLNYIRAANTVFPICATASTTCGDGVCSPSEQSGATRCAADCSVPCSTICPDTEGVSCPAVINHFCGTNQTCVASTNTCVNN